MSQNFCYHPNSLSILETIYLKTITSQKYKIRPFGSVFGKIEYFGFHDRFIFIKLEKKDYNPLTDRLFWFSEGLDQRNYPIGCEVVIYYGSVKINLVSPECEIFFIHSIEKTRDNAW